MKITRILPKPLAIAWQEYDINQLETHYKYHQMIANNCKARLGMAQHELDRLRGK